MRIANYFKREILNDALTLNGQIAGDWGEKGMRATPLPDAFPKMNWSAERIEELKVLIAQGHSRGKIAKMFGCARNAIVGKAYRLGIVGPEQAKQVGARIVNERKRRANALRSSKPGDAPPLTTRGRWLGKAVPKQYKLPKFPVCPDEPEPLHVSLLDLTDSHCHWVCEGTDDHCLSTYCGHPSVDGRWCAHHYSRVYQP